MARSIWHSACMATQLVEVESFQMAVRDPFLEALIIDQFARRGLLDKVTVPGLYEAACRCKDVRGIGRAATSKAGGA